MTEKEDIYCAEQIKIPSSFPYILKQYAKAAIRTQPYDLLQWTCAYFRALANSEIPPVKVNDLTFFSLLLLRAILSRPSFVPFETKTISSSRWREKKRDRKKFRAENWRVACLISGWFVWSERMLT